MELTAFRFRIENNAAHITLIQGKRGNPFDAAFCTELNQIATECDLNRGIRAVLIDAEGPYFSVGGDLKSLAGSDHAGLSRFVKTATADIHMAVARLARMDAPVVLACNALVAGGAVALAAGADFVLTGPDAKFYAAFAGIGFSSDCGSSYFLPRRVGARKAFSFFTRNETWDAQRALDNGLVSEIHDANQVDTAAKALATQLAQGPTLAFGKYKNLMLDSSSNTLEHHLEMEARALTDCTRTTDAWNAVRAVGQKQKPEFNYE